MIDTHFHFDPSVVSVDGLLASMDAAGIEKTALIPALCPPLSLTWYAELAIPPLRRIIHQRTGLLHKLAVSIYDGTAKGDGRISLLGKEYPLYGAPDNALVQEAVDAHPERFIGWVCVNPAGPSDPVAEAEEWMAKPGRIGVKAHSFWHDYPVSELSDVAVLCEEKGWPMLLHLGVDLRGDYRFLPERFPKLKIVYAHTGIPYGYEVSAYARAMDGVFVDISSSTYVDQQAAEQALRLAGPEKVIFGTDGPYFHVSGDRFDYPRFIEGLKALHMSDADFERVSVHNFAELAGLA